MILISAQGVEVLNVPCMFFFLKELSCRTGLSYREYVSAQKTNQDVMLHIL